MERPARDHRARGDGVRRPPDRRLHRPWDAGRTLELPADGRLASDEGPNHLRADDLLFIAVAAIPGAVAGGRLGYYLLHYDYYSAHPGAIFDISQGGFELSLAVVGGTLTAAVVAALLGAPVGRWMHAAIVPLLLALAAGKAAMVLGGDGQGLPWDGNLATAYLGPGPVGVARPDHAVACGAGVRGAVHGRRPAGLLTLLTLGRSGGARVACSLSASPCGPSDGRSSRPRGAIRRSSAR